MQTTFQDSPPAAAPANLLPRTALLPFLLVTSLFFLWGVPNNLNDVLIRQFMKSFAITRFQAGLVQSAFYMGYFLLALPAALYMRRVGYKAGIVTGLLLFALGCLLFWPAALVGRYSFFLGALFIMASGLAFLETASNSYIALAGPPQSSERRLNISQAFNPLGAIAGAAIGTLFILSGIELSPTALAALQHTHRYTTYLHSETLRVITPYVALSAVALLLALAILLTPFPRSQDEAPSPGHPSSAHSAGRATALRNPYLLAAIAAQFFYVGAQVGTWSYFLQYVQQYTLQPEKRAGYLLMGTLAMFGLGRFSSAWLMKFVRPARLMLLYSLVNIALTAVAVLHPGWLGMGCIFLTSFFMSLMYPTIFALGLHNMGQDTKVAGSLLVMSIVGGAVLTPLMGLLSRSSLATAYLIPLTGYLIVLAFSWVSLRRPATQPSRPERRPSTMGSSA